MYAPENFDTFLKPKSRGVVNFRGVYCIQQEGCCLDLGGGFIKSLSLTPLHASLFIGVHQLTSLFNKYIYLFCFLGCCHPCFCVDCEPSHIFNLVIFY